MPRTSTSPKIQLRTRHDELLEGAIRAAAAWLEECPVIGYSKFNTMVRQAQEAVLKEIAESQELLDKPEALDEAWKAGLAQRLTELHNLSQNGFPPVKQPACRLRSYSVREQVPAGGRSAKTLSCDLTLQVTAHRTYHVGWVNEPLGGLLDWPDDESKPEGLGQWKPRTPVRGNPVSASAEEETWRLVVAPAGTSALHAFERLQQLRVACSGNRNRFEDMGLKNYLVTPHHFGVVTDDLAMVKMACEQGYRVMLFGTTDEGSAELVVPHFER